MPETVVAPLPAWESFYVIVGSASAVLIGLVFVAITLVADSRARRSEEAFEEHLAAFTSSSVVHLCAVLLVCALLSGPWETLTTPSWLLGGCGLAGVAYGLLTIRRLRQPSNNYQPLREDWLWYAVCPLGAYAALLGAAVLLVHSPTRALFAVGAILVLLLFLGLRNAWDVATYSAVQRIQLRHERYRGRPARGRVARRREAASRRNAPRETPNEK